MNYELDTCLLYTSDAADDTPCVDLGGRRIIKNAWFLILYIVSLIPTVIYKVSQERPWTLGEWEKKVLRLLNIILID